MFWNRKKANLWLPHDDHQSEAENSFIPGCTCYYLLIIRCAVSNAGSVENWSRYQMRWISLLWWSVHLLIAVLLSLCHHHSIPVSDQILINKNFGLDRSPTNIPPQRRSIHLTNSPIRSEWRRQEKSIPSCYSLHHL